MIRANALSAAQSHHGCCLVDVSISQSRATVIAARRRSVGQREYFFDCEFDENSYIINHAPAAVHSASNAVVRCLGHRAIVFAPLRTKQACCNSVLGDEEPFSVGSSARQNARRE
jgi:hypothetical protein